LWCNYNSPAIRILVSASIEEQPVPVVYGSTALIADAVGRWRDAGVDELIIPDGAMPKGVARYDAYSPLAELLTPF
jgi:hypothetical protein